MHCPKVTAYADHLAFFKDFILENRQRSKAFSTRFFARRLGWPQSYLNDMLAGRKSLSVVRALQFARYFELDHAATEHLVFLALKDDPEQTVGQYFKDKLENECDASVSDIGEPAASTVVESMDHIFVYEILSWAGRRLPSLEIQRVLLFHPLSLERIDAVVADLERLGTIAIAADGGVDVLIPTLSLGVVGFANGDLSPARVQAAFAKHQLDYWEHGRQKGPLLSQSCFVELSPEQVNDVKERMRAFYNWTLKLDRAARAVPRDEAKGHLLFHVATSLLPLLDREIAAETLKPKPAPASRTPRARAQPSPTPPPPPA